jgi:hypothetical protein
LRRFKEAAAEIVDGVLDAIENVDPGQLDALIEDLVRVREEGRTLLIVGAGWSSLMGRAFAMRLMHLDFNVYIMGETIIPSIEKEDDARAKGKSVLRSYSCSHTCTVPIPLYATSCVKYSTDNMTPIIRNL